MLRILSFVRIRSSQFIFHRNAYQGSVIPENMRKIDETTKQQVNSDMHRDVSSQQTEPSGSLCSERDSAMSFEDPELLAKATETADDCFDLQGCSFIESAVTANVPEPFIADDKGNFLKEGLSEGLADCVKDQGSRWSMEDRLDNYRPDIDKDD